MQVPTGGSLPPPLLGVVNPPRSSTAVCAGHGACPTHLGLGLVFVLVVEKLVPAQHKPALLPVLHDAPLLFQPARLQHGAAPARAGGLPGAPARLPHHQAFGAGCKPRAHQVSEQDASLFQSWPYPGTQLPCGQTWSLGLQGMTTLGPFPAGLQGDTGWSVSAATPQGYLLEAGAQLACLVSFCYISGVLLSLFPHVSSSIHTSVHAPTHPPMGPHIHPSICSMVHSFTHSAAIY